MTMAYRDCQGFSMCSACFAGSARPGREGFALVTSLLIILLLSLIAVAAIIIATAEKRTSFAETTHTKAVLSADAGGESAIGFLVRRETPPRIRNFADMVVDSVDVTGLYASQNFNYLNRYVDRNRMPEGGWGVEYVAYIYHIASAGRAEASSRSGVNMLVSRIFREGY